MRAGWTAGVTRARLLQNRAVGAAHAREVARSRSLDAGIGVLAGSAYGERVHVGGGPAGAERAVAETLLWHLRILAGWLPARGAGLVRTLAGWFELANIDCRIAALAGDGREPEPFMLGGLATAWPRIDQARTIDEVADGIAASAWGEIEGRTPGELSLGLRVSWARRVREAAPGAWDWVAGAGALLLARELLVARSRDHTAQLRRLPGAGDRMLAAVSLDDLRAALPAHARWALDAIDDPRELWRGELGWWDRVERDAVALLRTNSDEAVVLAAVTLLGVDARRTARALQAAALGGGSEFEELVGGAA